MKRIPITAEIREVFGHGSRKRRGGWCYRVVRASDPLHSGGFGGSLNLISADSFAEAWAQVRKHADSY